ncbi:DUF6623 family protein [Actinosynnema sp. CA-299493]
MAETSAFWVHGQAGVPQAPPPSWMTLGGGPEVTLADGKDLWVHFPIPTPVLLKGKRATLRRVHVLYFTSNEHSKIGNVHVRDGYPRFLPKDDLGWWGDHSTGLGGPWTTVEVGWDGINWGIGVSVRLFVRAPPLDFFG